MWGSAPWPGQRQLRIALALLAARLDPVDALLRRQARRTREEHALHTVLAARPDVFNHNIETVRRLHRRMRGARASYDGALHLLRRAREVADYALLTKSGIIVGLGETNDEVVETMRDLRGSGVNVVTIGQYLQPSSKHAAIDRWGAPRRVPAGCASRAKHSASAPSLPAPLSAPATAPTSRSTPLQRAGRCPARELLAWDEGHAARLDGDSLFGKDRRRRKRTSSSASTRRRRPTWWSTRAWARPATTSTPTSRRPARDGKRSGAGSRPPASVLPAEPRPTGSS